MPKSKIFKGEDFLEKMLKEVEKLKIPTLIILLAPVTVNILPENILNRI